MKRFSSAFVCFLLILLSLTSCSSYDDDIEAILRLPESSLHSAAAMPDSDTVTVSALETEPPPETTVYVETEVVTETAATIAVETSTTVAETTTPETTAVVTTTAPPETRPVETTAQVKATFHVVLNTNSGKYHLDENCRSVKIMKASNRQDRDLESLDVLAKAGYSPCSLCSGGTSTAVTTAVKSETTKKAVPDGQSFDVVVNENSNKIHVDFNCRHVKSIKAENRRDVTLTSAELDSMLDGGYSLCKVCSK